MTHTFIKSDFFLSFVWVLLFCSIQTNLAAQNSHEYVLFSSTGDTVLTHTSCITGGIDTLVSTFIIQKKIGNQLEIIAMFDVYEPNKNSIPCADLQLIPKDTLRKYNLTRLGRIDLSPKKKVEVRSKVIGKEIIEYSYGKPVYKRTIRHSFKIKNKTFYQITSHDITSDKKGEIIMPKVSEVFINSTLQKYFVTISVYDEVYNPKTEGYSSVFTLINILN